MLAWHGQAISEELGAVLSRVTLTTMRALLGKCTWITELCCGQLLKVMSAKINESTLLLW